jgi:hypothetical protein
MSFPALAGEQNHTPTERPAPRKADAVESRFGTAAMARSRIQNSPIKSDESTRYHAISES